MVYLFGHRIQLSPLTSSLYHAQNMLDPNSYGYDPTRYSKLDKEEGSLSMSAMKLIGIGMIFNSNYLDYFIVISSTLISILTIMPMGRT